MPDNNYGKAMRTILRLLSGSRKVSLPAILDEAKDSAVPQEVASACLRYLESQGYISSAEGAEGGVDFVVTNLQKIEELAEQRGHRKPSLVLSLPAYNRYGMGQVLAEKGLDYLTTDEAFVHLFSEARSEILICSPFVEYEGLARFRRVFEVKLHEGCRIFLLGRQLGERDVGSRFKEVKRFLDSITRTSSSDGLFEVRDYHLSQSRRVESSSHGKFIVVDGKQGYVGSADLRPNALYRNLEVGLLVEGEIAADLRQVFWAVFTKAKRVLGLGEDDARPA